MDTKKAATMRKMNMETITRKRRVRKVGNMVTKKATKKALKRRDIIIKLTKMISTKSINSTTTRIKRETIKSMVVSTNFTRRKKEITKRADITILDMMKDINQRRVITRKVTTQMSIKDIMESMDMTNIIRITSTTAKRAVKKVEARKDMSRRGTKLLNLNCKGIFFAGF